MRAKMKLLLAEIVLLVVAAACIYEMAFLIWLSTTPVTADHHARIKMELYFTAALLVLDLALSLVLFVLFVLRKWKKKGST
jgi:hypothetical protein